MGVGDVAIKRALISASDKSGIVELAQFLSRWNVEILSTGGTSRVLREAGLEVVEVADYTGFPEILDGRVKTLHPAIHGGILARRDQPDHAAAMDTHGIGQIDLVVVNLYPFEKTILETANVQECIEQIDIGGPALLRASAKNHDHVTVVTDAADYPTLMEDMRTREGSTGAALRQRLAGIAFARTAAYDVAIAQWLTGRTEGLFPRRASLSGTLCQTLRYGENPHQKAAVYATGEPRPGVTTARQLQGKALSYNNLNDTDAAFDLVSEFDKPAVVIVKHASPCGVATSATLAEAFRSACRCDPVSAFGGIVAVNRPLDAGIVEAFGDLFLEVVIAPEVTADAQALLTARGNLRVLETGSMPDPRLQAAVMTPLSGGFLLQDRDSVRVESGSLKRVTRRSPNSRETEDLLFAFTVAKHVKSNAIVYARDGATIGIGSGQPSRVDSARIAAWKAREFASNAGHPDPFEEGVVAASDAFFPFRDGLVAVADAGATAVIQPGGSVRDQEVIQAAEERDIAMVFTGVRHFRH